MTQRKSDEQNVHNGSFTIDQQSGARPLVLRCRWRRNVTEPHGWFMSSCISCSTMRSVSASGRRGMGSLA